ncbi:hypothetical protein ACFYXD_27895 [Streptomyces platensis]|uniref:hypothetical protein n=1 Tax=Streptomyces platensis TaxID=58346 RepID=UPI0036BD753D
MATADLCALRRPPDGMADGVTDGVMDGVVDGVTDGVVDGATDGPLAEVTGGPLAEATGGVPGAMDDAAFGTPVREVVAEALSPPEAG